MFLLSGTGNDLIDYISADDYWQAQHIQVTTAEMLVQLRLPVTPDTTALLQHLADTDADSRRIAWQKIVDMGPGTIVPLREAARSANPELAARIQAAIDELTPGEKALQIRRLMAIRMLAQLHASDALPGLQGALNDPDFFIRDCAREAIREIQGHDSAPDATVAARADPSWADISTLPARCDVLAQLHLCNAQPGNHVRFTDIRQISQRWALLHHGSTDAAANADEAISALAISLCTIADQIGNFRIDTITAGLWSNVAGQPGVGIYLIRGVYDSHAVTIALRHQPVLSTMRGDVEIFTLNADAASHVLAVLVPMNDNLLVFASAQDIGPGGAALDLDEISTAARGIATPDKDKPEMARLVESSDRSSFFWAAVHFTPGLQQLLPLPQWFKSATLSVKLIPASKPLTAPATLLLAAPDLALRFSATITPTFGINSTTDVARWLGKSGRRAQPTTAPASDDAAAMSRFLREINITLIGDALTVTGKVSMHLCGAYIGRRYQQ